MRIKFAHACIVVKDIQYSLEFYEKVLGARIIREHEDQRMFLVLTEAGGQGLELVQFKHGWELRKRGPVDHLAFWVKDLEEALVPVLEAGGQLLLPEPIISGTIKLMFFQGPDGERIEFMEDMSGD